jgi:hypothetical protein
MEACLEKKLDHGGTTARCDGKALAAAASLASRTALRGGGALLATAGRNTRCAVSTDKSRSGTARRRHLYCRDHAEVMRWVERATDSLRQHGAKRVDIEHALGGTFLPAEVAGPSNTGAGHAAYRLA